MVDFAYDRLIRSEQLQRDIAAYRRVPPTGPEAELALVDAVDLGDSTDWELLYAEGPG